jgi:hypothetical protein
MYFILLYFMPTEYKPGKPNFQTPESFVEVLTSGNSTAINPPVYKKPTSDQIQIYKPYVITPHKPLNKISPVAKINNFLLNDFLWFTAALIFLFGAIFFYFQFLQPIILRKYIDTANAQILESNQTLYKQINNVAEVQKNIFISVRKSQSDSCSENSKYNNYKKDKTTIETLGSALVVDNKLKALPNFLVFSDSIVQNNYNKFIKEYTTYLQEFQPTVNQLNEVINFENYKDSLIDNCIDIKNSKGDTEELKAICKDQNIRLMDYQKNASVAITNTLLKYTDTIKSLCSDVNQSTFDSYPTYNSFLLKFLTELDNIQAIKLNQTTQSNANVLELFSDTASKYTTQLEDIYNSRQDISKIWYLLKVNLR